jgi:galactonate dehydratase
MRDNGTTRRRAIAGAFATLGTGAFAVCEAEAQQKVASNAPIGPREPIKITRLETFLVKPRWLFLKIHTNAGIVGLGEPLLEGRARTCAEAVKEIEPYLIGKDPRRVVHHWQAIYRQAFYRGGEILTSALSGIDIALWDIKGKALGVPVYELLGGPTRNRVRIYAHTGTPGEIKAALARGFRAFKTKPAMRDSQRYIATPAQVKYVEEQFERLRKFVGDDVDLAIDFHGAVSPATSKLLIKAIEPYQPMFIEEPCLHQNVDSMVEIARGTHIPIATGERVFTKWGFREILEKKAAAVLQPDLCHAGGITEVRLIAGMAEAYYATIAPHNPLGPIALAAGVQIAASIPNFLCAEQATLGEGYLKSPFTLREGYIDLPAGPGLGIELDENAVADKLGHDWRNAEVFDEEDGSVGENHGSKPPVFPN